MRKIGSDYLFTRGSVVLFLVSYAAIAAALFWLAIVNARISDEHGQRLTQDASILLADCRRENYTRTAVRRVLTFAEAQSIANQHMTPAQRRQVQRFYESAIDLVPLINCHNN